MPDIYTLQDLNNVRNNPSGSFQLLNDVNALPMSPWVPIYNFSGNFNGNGHKISGIRIAAQEQHNGGLFDKINPGGKIHNLRIANAEVMGNKDGNWGTLAGFIDSGEISNVIIEDTVVNQTAESGWAGALAGGIRNSTINQCSTSGSISGAWAGGLAGYIDHSNITQCAVSGSISGAWAGGLAGYIDNSTITQCTASGFASGSYAGGIAGSASNTTFTNCFSSCTVQPSSNVKIGGFAGEFWNTTATYCYSNGPVSIAGTVSGGFIGASETPNVYTACYWDTEATGCPATEGSAMGRTTAEMQTQSNYTGWNFDTIWEVKPNTYPMLRNARLAITEKPNPIQEFNGEIQPPLRLTVPYTVTLPNRHLGIPFALKLKTQPIVNRILLLKGSIFNLPVAKYLKNPLLHSLNRTILLLKNHSLPSACASLLTLDKQLRRSPLLATRPEAQSVFTQLTIIVGKLSDLITKNLKKKR